MTPTRQCALKLAFDKYYYHGRKSRLAAIELTPWNGRKETLQWTRSTKTIVYAESNGVNYRMARGITRNHSPSLQPKFSTSPKQQQAQHNNQPIDQANPR